MKPDSKMASLYLDEISIRLAARTPLCLSATVRPGDILTGVAAERRQSGMLLQDPLLFPRLSVGGNPLSGLSIRKRQPIFSKVGSAGFVTRDRTDAPGALATVGEETGR